MESNSQLEALATEYNSVREQIRAHTSTIKEALTTIQTSKDQITVLATRLNELQVLYFELTKGKEAINGTESTNPETTNTESSQES